MNRENAKICLDCCRYNANIEFYFEEMLKELEEKIHDIEENIENNHEESLQIIINCIDYVEENIQENCDKIKKIEDKIHTNNKYKYKYKLRPRPKSI